MALDYYHFETSSSPIYSKTSGIAPTASTITKDNSLDLANPSSSKKLYHSNQDSHYHNPIVIVVTPSKESPYTEDSFNFKTVKMNSANPLIVYLLVFIIFVLFMIYKKR